VIEKLKDYPGIGLREISRKSDPKGYNPFFKSNVLSYLAKINQKPTGRMLIEAIGRCKPGDKFNAFPKGINVVIRPPDADVLMKPGLMMSDDEPIYKPLGGKEAYNTWMIAAPGERGALVPLLRSKAQTIPATRAAACCNTEGASGVGSQCQLRYSNREMLSKSGTWLPAEIIMAHELIHCLHCLTGTRDPKDNVEEWKTTGIKGYEDLDITENKIRAELDYPARTKYFQDD
jgi:hypothetical protein